MNEFTAAVGAALSMIVTLDAGLTEIVLLSLRISLSAVAVASIVALPLGAAIALQPFPGRRGVIVLLNAMMGLPPVVVGLVVYLLLSRAGPLGEMGLLFTPTAMVIAQSIIVAPIIAALARQTIADLHEEYDEHLRSLGCTRIQSVATLLLDGRYRLLTGIMAGFGRAIAEVGAVLIVGGNIQHSTRVMTTTIALETSKGNLALALGLGLILVILALGVNAAALVISDAAQRRYG
ncbi:ABC transporter permease [Lentisalinibacter sediminis]|uniref:ABC transporter permease n=1 Tax=Lentisalinibacter sediminis TaxID=2992237 RepID=UPI00386B937E